MEQTTHGHPYLISESLKEKILQFIQYTQPARFSRNLRSLLIWYLIYEDDAPSVDLN